MPQESFDAPWGTSLRVMTSLTCLVLLVVAVYGVLTWEGETARPAIMVGGPAAVILAALPFVVRGYRLSGGTLFVRRLFWETRIPLEGLRRARFDPEAMSGSLRTFGNGGLFSFTGRFRNRSLGPYRAWVTDPKRAVVIELEDRTVVVSPGRPREMEALLLLRTAVDRG